MRLSDVENILVVCTGNVCRSPYAQLVLQHQLDRAGVTDIEVRSAGTHAREMAPIPPPMSRLLRGEGVDPLPFRAQQLTTQHIDRASLVLTATREHRTHVVRMQPRALRRVFTLRQVGRLLATMDHAPVGQRPVDSLAGACAMARGQAAPSAGVDDDVVDPWRGDDDLYAESVGQMTQPIEAVVASLIALVQHAGHADF